MATIEPRLIHLLNESTATPKPHHNELPPIKGLSLPKPTSRSHPLPIEPDASHRSDGSNSNNGAQLPSQLMPPLFSVAEEGPINSKTRRDPSYASVGDRNLLHHVSSQDLRMILDDAPDITDDMPVKKRPVKEDFVQLPQPLKKQKAVSQQHMFPPIIMGILEPPRTNNSPLYPPISSASFDKRPRSEPPQALSLGKAPEPNVGSDEKDVSSPPADTERTPTGRIKRKAAKPRRKWTEEETNYLLLGASKHGVGKWTDILADHDYKFNDRTAGDLKDRFRTCCPEELKASTKTKQGKSGLTRADLKPRKGLMSENILNEPEGAAQSDTAQSINNDSDSASKQRKSRAHRKNLDDLAELGIKGPFKKSQRRGRRPFTEQDDREILEGFELFGPQWTKIQRDPRFHLSTRQPTDLRDRLRNKYPEKFASAEKTTMQTSEPGRGNDLLEPSVDMTIGNSLDKPKSTLAEPPASGTNSKKKISKWTASANVTDGPEPSQVSSGPFWSEATGSGFQTGGIGEMDISRLLLDDAQLSNEPVASDRRGQG